MPPAELDAISELNRSIVEMFRSRGYRRAFPEKVLSEWTQRTACPQNDALCEQAVWLKQEVLLAGPEAMEQVAAAVRKVHANAAAIAKL